MEGVMAAESAPGMLETGALRPTTTTPAPGAARLPGQEALSDADFFASWLNKQCVTQTGTRAGVVLRPSAQGLMTAASWPAKRPAAQDLARITARAASTERPIIAWARRPDGKEGLD